MKRATALMLTMALFSTTTLGASQMIVTNPPYVADDVLTAILPGGFDASGGTVVAWDNLTNTLSAYVGGTATPLGAPAAYLAAHPGSAWNSFVRFEPSGGSVWVGFTAAGNTDDRIYQVDLSGNWTYRATLPGNFDLEFSGGSAFVSGLNSANWSDPNCVWLLDATGANAHDLVATVGGYSTGLAFDEAGDLYVVSSATNQLVRFSPAQVALASGPGGLALADGDTLSGLEYSPYDVSAAAGMVALTINGAASQLCLWNGTVGGGLNYDVVGVGAGTNFWDWFTVVDFDGGGMYIADGAVTGLARLVPEPASGTLLALAGVVLTCVRRRRGRTR